MRANGHKPSLNRDAQTGGVWPTKTLAEISLLSIVQLRIQLAIGLEEVMQNVAVSLQQWAVFLDPSRGRQYSPITLESGHSRACFYASTPAWTRLLPPLPAPSIPHAGD